jgi:hypothetical protein
MENVKTFGINIGALLVEYGCTRGEVKYTASSGVVKTIKCLKRAEDDELMELDAFFDDVYEGDQDIIKKNKLQKEELKEGDSGSDTNF